jgi:hypothetical protein
VTLLLCHHYTGVFVYVVQFQCVHKLGYGGILVFDESSHVLHGLSVGLMPSRVCPWEMSIMENKDHSYKAHSTQHHNYVQPLSMRLLLWNSMLHGGLIMPQTLK